MTLGDLRTSEPVYVGGALVGYTESSEDFSVGKNSTGATYDGKTVGRMSLDLNDDFSPEASITKGLPNGYSFNIGGETNLEDWETFITDVLIHIKELRAKGE